MILNYSNLYVLLLYGKPYVRNATMTNTTPVGVFDLQLQLLFVEKNNKPSGNRKKYNNQNQEKRNIVGIYRH